MTEEGYMQVFRSSQYACLLQLLRFVEKVGIVEDYYMVYGEYAAMLAAVEANDEDVDHLLAQYVARWTEALYEA